MGRTVSPDRPRWSRTQLCLAPAMILDSISAKMQTERARSANSRRSGLPVKNLSDGTRLSVPCPSAPARAGTKGTRVGGHYGQCSRLSGDGRGTPSPCRYVPGTRILANIIFALKKNSRHLLIVMNACTVRPPRSMRAIRRSGSRTIKGGVADRTDDHALRGTDTRPAKGSLEDRTPNQPGGR